MRPFFENVASPNGSPTLVSFGVPSTGSAPSVAANGAARSLAIALLDRRLALRRVEPLALGRGEDDVEDAALLGRELRLDQVGRPLRVGAGDLELVAQAAADGGDEPIRTTMIPSHAPRTRHGCVAHARAQRASAPVDSRSCAASRAPPVRFVPRRAHS